KLFDALLSVSLEWMNVQPVHQPMAAVRPRVPIDTGAFGDDVTRLNKTGVFSPLLSAPGAVQALADWQLAAGYAAQGNDSQVQFFAQRAQQTQPDVFQLLGGAPKTGGIPPLPAPSLSGGADGVVDADVALHLPVRPLPPSFTANDRAVG